MSPLLVHPSRMNCRGCVAFEDYDGEMMCTNLITFHGSTPRQAHCFEYHPAFLQAVNKHLHLVDTLGEDHSDTMRAMMIVMEQTPPWMLDQFGDIAREMNLMPEATGYLEDGTPMFRLEDIAEKLGVPPEEAEANLQEMLAEHAALGLPMDGIVTDPRLIRPRQ